MQLSEILPALAIELEQLLKNQGEAELAAQVSQLTVIHRCRCGDDFCSSFYTQPKPEGHYGPSHRCFDLDAAEGMLLVDVVAEKIAPSKSSIALTCDATFWRHYKRIPLRPTSAITSGSPTNKQ